jgi:hypothetical protein
MTVLPPVILAHIALDETISALGDGANKTPAKKREDSEEATKRLQCACAAGFLTMVVINPRNGDYQPIPARYFNNRPMAEMEFASALFQATEVSEQAVVDPFFRAVLPYRGWAHGFVEPDFRAWLRNEGAGGPERSTVGAETRAVKALQGFFKSDPGSSLTKKQAYARLSQTEPLGKNAFARVWRRATEEFPERRNAGRKRRAQ